MRGGKGGPCNTQIKVTTLPLTYTNDNSQSEFSRVHKNGNIGINANFLSPYLSIYNFLLYLYHMMLLNTKLDASGCKRIRSI